MKKHYRLFPVNRRKADAFGNDVGNTNFVLGLYKKKNW